MVKPIYCPFSHYILSALELLGQLVLKARAAGALTAADHVARVGISNALQARIKRGDPGCSVGVFFEVASIYFVPLFDHDHRQLTTKLAVHIEKTFATKQAWVKSTGLCCGDGSSWTDCLSSARRRRFGFL